MSIDILVLVEDLLFLSKIQQTAQTLGVTVKAVEPAKAIEQAAQDQPKAVILDLNHRSLSAIETARALKANPATQLIHIVGFVSHVQMDLVNAAHEAGCDMVLARSAFSRQLPQFLKKFVGSDSAASPGH